jgi:membrane protease YdiL (CAAX protease family)
VAPAAALLFAAVLLAAAWRDRQRRGWAMLAIAGTMLYFLLRELPRYFLAGAAGGVDWNWSGHLLALAGMLLLARMLVRRVGLSARDLGLAWPKRPGLAIAVVAAALVASFVVHRIAGGRIEPIPASAWVFVAIMPGLVEEVAFRGVLLAAAERALPPARPVAGVMVSAGAVVLTAAFVVLHGFTLGMVVSVLPGALLYLWLRLSTGSIVAPSVAHNLWNLTVLFAHR